MPILHHRVHRSEGFLSVDGIPIARIAVGNSKQKATRVQWSNAAADKGVPIVMQRQMREARAAAYACPTSAVCRR